MSVIELKTYRWRCERCNATKICVGASEYESRPGDWGRREIRDCGMTGYTTHIDLCAGCFNATEEP